MKSVQVLAAFRAFMDGKREDAVSYMRQIEASEQRAGNMTVSAAIRRMVDARAGCQTIRLPDAPDSLDVRQPARSLESLVLSDVNRLAIRQVVREWKHRDILSDNGLAPRNVIMLYGPSGNGKTVLAEALASALALPLAMARYDEIIDSYRGVTLDKIAAVFKFAMKTACVVFFDEADSLVSCRIAGAKDSGKEENRTTNGVLIELDRLPPSAMVVFATNMRGDLDPALSRRVALELELGPPCNGQREKMVGMMTERFPMIRDGQWVERAAAAESFAAMEAIAMDAARASVLANVS